MNFPFQRGAEVKNQSIITTQKRDDRHKKKKTVKSIHSSLRSESEKCFRKSIYLGHNCSQGLVICPVKVEILYTDYS
jgi:hypothetical protein